MFTPPAEPPTWGQCVLTIERHVHKRDWRAAKYAMRKVTRVTGVRWRFVKHDGQITVRYGRLDASVIGWTDWASAAGVMQSARIRLDRADTRHLTKHQRRNLLMHELGHVFGLPHSNRARSVMWRWTTVSTKWSASDRRALKQATEGCKQW